MHNQEKKGEINISTMKTHQMPNRWQVSFLNQNLQNDIVAPRL